MLQHTSGDWCQLTWPPHDLSAAADAAVCIAVVLLPILLLPFPHGHLSLVSPCMLCDGSKQVAQHNDAAKTQCGSCLSRTPAVMLTRPTLSRPRPRPNPSLTYTRISWTVLTSNNWKKNLLAGRTFAKGYLETGYTERNCCMELFIVLDACLLSEFLW